MSCLNGICRSQRFRNIFVKKHSSVSYESKSTRGEPLSPDCSGAGTDPSSEYQQQQSRQNARTTANPATGPHTDTRYHHDSEPLEGRGESINVLGSLPFENYENDESEKPGAYRDLDKCDFIYDIIVQSPTGSRFRRRLTLKFDADINIMSDHMLHRLGTELKPYYGDPISITGQSQVTPLGTVGVSWTFCGQTRIYRTDFYVVPDANYDFLLGRPSMRNHELYRVDSEIARRLSKSYQD
ncbi:hypothetical protein ASPBRDRAFT_156813 [Aspergillus brasiliensis CBS 101740]|uniref:Uncharacterized protein n=1 Tax=Aspergillus brasiliensis (strain CBS 101740 / IMI 381727 / IBT 21946) TaxID=767769 RepID=A0A1L9UEU9_ASPBC|nr:hypothetical protein ASPBRDRAFT_156813 [Aspergillus brasiliensis CBS 101740]